MSTTAFSSKAGSFQTQAHRLFGSVKRHYGNSYVRYKKASRNVVRASQAGGYPEGAGAGARGAEGEGTKGSPVPKLGFVDKSMEFVTLLLDGYNSALKKHPVTTKAFTSLVGFAIGDRIAQTMGGAGSFDTLRFLRMSLYGVLIDGPVGHYFYRFLDTKIYPEAPKSNAAVLGKTAVDQLVWAPIMTCVFLAFLTTLEGHPESIMEVIQRKLAPIFLANLTVWPVAHLINFRFVPPEQRILFNNIVAIAWTTYLSYTCGASTASGGHSGTPRDALAAGIPCVAAATSTALQSPHAVDIVRQTSALQSMLVGWGVDGLPTNTDAGTELLINYFQLKAEVLSTVCHVE
ncbi:hypothetical protein M9434_003036 [Picochlorum sp. BPE23]|nr:hypothetical protein M9434_003036 [Picochlorum sp. BPE23]KAI8105080.1 hypothetical protein M9435_000252 [Picochlorum sp. BPE23]